MDPPQSPRCTALAGQMSARGLTYEDIARLANIDLGDVQQIIWGQKKPTNAQFNAIAVAMDLQVTGAPHDPAHTTN